MASYLRPRRGKKATATSQLTASNPLKRGEIFFEVPDTGVGTGTGKIKMGDGATAYASLPYFMEQPTVDYTNAVVAWTNTTAASSAPYTDNATYVGNIIPSASLKTIFTNLKKLLLNYNSQLTTLNNDLAGYSSGTKVAAKATSATSATYSSTANYAKSAPTMKGATTAAAGTVGLVPAPSKGSNLTFLRGDGIWADPVLTGVGNVRYNESTDTVQIYNGSTWVDWKNGNLTNTYIIKNGILDLDIASNIAFYPAYSNNGGATRTNTTTTELTISSDSSSIILKHKKTAQLSGYGVTGFFEKQIDLTNYNYLEMDFSIVHTGYDNNGTAASALVISSINSGTPYTTAGYKMILGPTTESNSGTVSINVSGLSGYYYIGVEIGLRPSSSGEYTECKIFNMWLS